MIESAESSTTRIPNCRPRSRAPPPLVDPTFSSGDRARNPCGRRSWAKARNAYMATTIAHAPDASASGVIGQQSWVASLAGIENAHYLSLTTFRRNGAPVMTPVWFARVGQALYVITDGDTGKVKRIRHHPTVRVAPCTARGKPTGAVAPAVARVVPVDEASYGMRALSGKYGWLFTAFELVHRLQRKTPVMLEIVQ